ncbi:uncharacterized protein RSE6_12047 [Rhynchosporium secalis]|uniref:Uncharacterized protein n=1 Tax=Rhynchosporium secalis TaxID=38038 RepID=A0A1E1MPD7_RHYSE|nr:uncharacterized protein RSE6_12047 [Rhynchosporium secalis]
MVYHSSYSTPDSTPLAPEVVEVTTPWSDISVEDLRPKIKFNQNTLKIRRFGCGSYKTRFRGWGRAMWLSWFVIAAIWWAFSQRSDGHYLIEKQTFFDLSTLDGLKYIDATHPYIRYVGRWLATADQTHKDGSFPGVYFDFTLNGSSTVLISLHNSDHQDQSPAKVFRSSSSALPFLPLTNSSRAAPISLLVRIDDEEYIVLPNATSLVSICPGNLNPLLRHEIRIIAPMVGNDAVETLQIEGIWINEGGQLLPHPGSPNPGDRFKQQTKTSAPRRMVEIVTDLPGSTASKEKSKNTGTARSIMKGVLGWEYLLGEMFGSDHVTIGNEGMCLIPDCIGGRGSPAGLADVFFQWFGPLPRVKDQN